MRSLRDTVLALAVVAAHAAKGSDSQKPIVQKHETTENPLNDEMAKSVQESLDFWHVPGMAVGVIDDDHIYTEGYGYATLPDVRATADTLWYGASTSKAQSAALLAHLVHSGNYSQLAVRGWETPIAAIVRDDFVLSDEWATAHVTLNDAVSHRTGMGRHDLSMHRVRGGRPVTPRDVARNLRHLPMMAEPRVRYSYCNLMYVTLGHVAETLTGVWLGEALRTHLWAPLGMDATYFDTADALGAPQHFAGGYAWDERAGNYTPVDYMSVTDAGAAGGVISNVKDYAKWVRCLLHQSAPLSKETHADIRTPRMFVSAETDGNSSSMGMSAYGLGWNRATMHDRTVFEHSGGMHAYGAEVFWLPEINFGVVAFGNTAMSSNFAALEIVYRLIEDKLGIPDDQRIDIRAKSIKSRDSLPTREEAIEALFPDRPETPQLGSFDAGQLVGHYKNEGWGDVTFTVADNYEGSNKTVLVGPRPDTSFRHTFILEHITGDYWLVLASMLGNSRYTNAYFTAKFVAGVDGNPSAMDLDTQGVSKAGDGIIQFTKID
ncbi:hypothetical protein V2A60_006568 [Cordyceps javanica]|uniref:Beta-lactamase-type transpeptidase fold domain-containing protein n=1 Tax=Cordyceps javanica TaxID=43265 RepID=A0A545V7K1_9HYPO|nr:Beta-lactamase-type transpeptidase fold domain-containing protein [Cordyceps javanica]TQW09123.1 Beta-lactamase-type transpeptidase fold domain containing protein [Cordyceps javanica]